MKSKTPRSDLFLSDLPMFDERTMKEIGVFCREMEKELDTRTNSIIIHNGQALACSDAVKSAYEELRRESSELKWANHKIVDNLSPIP